MRVITTPTRLALAGLMLLSSPATALAAPAAATPPDPDAQQQLLEQLEERRQEMAERWRRFGDIEVDWENWKPLEGSPHVWVAPWRRAITRPISISSVKWPEAVPRTGTAARLPDQAVAVDCTKLVINRQRLGSAWGQWRIPLKGSSGEDLLIQACSSLPEGSTL